MNAVDIKSVEEKIAKLDREARILRAMVLYEKFFGKNKERDAKSLIESKGWLDEMFTIGESLGLNNLELLSKIQDKRREHLSIFQIAVDEKDKCSHRKSPKKEAVVVNATMEQWIVQKWGRKGGLISIATNTGCECKLCGVVNKEMMIVHNKGKKLHIMCAKCADKLGRKMHNAHALTQLENEIVLSAKEEKKNATRLIK